MNQETSAQIITDTNNRIYDRNVPFAMLQPYINVRPVSTKYSIMPIIDPRKMLNVKMPIMPTYNPERTFNPGNDSGPWSGFASGINVESELRNQIYALQKCSQSVYVPNSTSDLYQYQFQPKTVVNQPFPDLFSEQTFCPFNPNEGNIQEAVFHNPTRLLTLDAHDSPYQEKNDS